ncbi:AtpZ/AtpI family protein [Donghicola sp. C2-DW-16]|uniref:AtpZ/AtpI family protein n=1 Tax=Donghicola mangrovi TaxID=2729614 RepID=A0ABX2PH95_9RHOB|nr:AtpZ/AtpI family protein [Donghicola mangrovi]NVO28868.1 AtpZ/AtpI family protein [Donghicola mangrovi]
MPEPEKLDEVKDAAQRALIREALQHDDPEPSLANRLGQIGVLGWAVVTPILLGIVLGRLADRAAHSGIFFTAPAIFIGAGIGLHAAWKWMHRQ